MAYKPRKKSKKIPPAVFLPNPSLDEMSRKSTVKLPVYRRTNEHIPSRDEAESRYIAVRKSMTDPAFLAKEPEHVRKEIIAKSKRLAPAYNKGAVQYISDETDTATLGRKI